METTEKKELKPGDVIYSRHYRALNGRCVIERVTETQAISGTLRFKKDVSRGWVTKIGKEKWDSCSYYLETPELKAEYEHRVLISKATKIKFEELTSDQLKAILNIVTP